MLSPLCKAGAVPDTPTLILVLDTSVPCESVTVRIVSPFTVFAGKSKL